MIMGFTQNIGRHSGLHTPWEELRQYSEAERLVATPLSWDSNWREVARFIAAYSSPATKIYVAAYSWGAGHGFVKLSKYLKGHGRNIEHAILVDPVYRVKYLPSWITAGPLNGISMTKLGRIKVTENVLEVTHFIQRENRPAGRQLKLESPRTKVNGPFLLKSKHAEMDDNIQVKQAILDVFQPEEGNHD